MDTTATTVAIIIGIEFLALIAFLLFRPQLQRIFEGMASAMAPVLAALAWTPARRRAAEALLLRVLAAVHAPSRRGNGRHRAMTA